MEDMFDSLQTAVVENTVVLVVSCGCPGDTDRWLLADHHQSGEHWQWRQQQTGDRLRDIVTS